jgi:MFS family permease
MGRSATIETGAAVRGAGPRILVGISLFWIALAFLTDGLITLVLPMHLEAVGRTDPAVLGSVAFIGLLAGMLTQPIAGAVSDRLRPARGRTPVLWAGAGGAVVALALLASARSAPAIAAAFVVVQMGTGVAQAAQQAYLPDQVPPGGRGLAGGLKGLMDVGGAALGFVVLGALLEWGGVGPALILTALVVILAAVGTGVLVREGPGLHRPPDRLRLASVARLDPWRDRSFLLAVAARFLFLLATFAVGRFFLFFMEDRVLPRGAGAGAEAGATLGMLALLTAVLALPAGWAADRWGRHPVMVGGAVSSAIGVTLLTTATTLGAVLAFGSLMSLGSAAFAAANWARLADTSPPEEAGRYLGLANVGTAGAAAVAGLLGTLVDRAGTAPGGGYAALFLSCASLFAASAALVMVDRSLARTIRRPGVRAGIEGGGIS